MAKRNGTSEQRRPDNFGSSTNNGYGASLNPNQTPLHTQAPSQQAPQASTAGNPADPYAQYGGYQNYVAMWYAAMQQQQQQQQGAQGGAEISRPTGMP